MKTLDQAYALLDQGKLAGAEQAFRELLQRTPDDPQVHWGLGRLASLAHEPAAAARHYAQCCQALPGQPRALIALGETLVALREFERAETTFRELVKQHPEDPNARYALGFYLVGAGKTGAARQELDEVIRLKADHLLAHQLRSRIITFTRACAELSALEALATDAIPPSREIPLRYALAKAMDDLGEYTAAGAYLERANALQLQSCDYRAVDMAQHFAAIRDTFTVEQLKTQAPVIEGAPRMLFIVGLPRSGSTLLEQCLCQHSAIDSAGESPTIGSQVGNAIHAMTGKAFPLGCAGLDEAELEGLARLYYSRLPRTSSGASIVIDKMPANFQSAGLIHAMLPEAVILHITRKPMDTAFSIYRNYFRQAEPFLCDLEDIARYSQYVNDTMAHWAEVLPGKIITLAYETLAHEPESTLRPLLENLGLDWQPEVLSPGGGSYVGTLSDTQVRAGLREPSTGHWRHYRHLFGTLEAKLVGQNGQPPPSRSI